MQYLSTYHREEYVDENGTQASQDEQMGLESNGQRDLNECKNEPVHVVPSTISTYFNLKEQRRNVISCHADESNEH